MVRCDCVCLNFITTRAAQGAALHARVVAFCDCGNACRLQVFGGSYLWYRQHGRLLRRLLLRPMLLAGRNLIEKKYITLALKKDSRFGCISFYVALSLSVRSLRVSRLIRRVNTGRHRRQALSHLYWLPNGRPGLVCIRFHACVRMCCVRIVS